MNNTGHAVPLLRHDGDGFKVDAHAFDDILRQSDLLHRKLVVISIVGEYRRGKSFFLNYVMQYLVNQGNANWLEGSNSSKLTGFSWRQGIKRETDGIVMWSQAFPLGDEYAVILLDTEGTYDEVSTNKTMSHVFACSALVSSLQIFNVFERITKQTMQEIQAFAEFGRLASCSGSQHAFQKLMFLIRDWLYIRDFPYGVEGGKGHLDNWLQSDKDGVRDTLSTCFSDVKCYLMPYPGDKVKVDPNFRGNISDMSENFATELKNVIEFIFSPRNIESRRIGGQELKLKDFMKFFEMFAKTLNESGVEPTTLFQAQVQICNNNAKQTALEGYRTKMDEYTLVEEPLDDLIEKHELFSEAAMIEFDKQPKMGGEQHSTTYRNILVHDIAILYSKYLNADTQKRVLKSKLDEQEKQLWIAENQRTMDELQHKHDMETAKLEQLALQKEFEAEQLAQAEEYKLKIHSLEQQTATERMQMEHQFQLKMDQMQRREDASREDMKRELEKHKRDLEESQKKAAEKVEEVKNDWSKGVMDVLGGVVSLLTQPVSVRGTLLHSLFKRWK